MAKLLVNNYKTVTTNPVNPQGADFVYFDEDVHI